MSRPRRRWAVYTLLLLIRFLGIVQRGYVHPDEFFQGGQELFFGHQQRRDVAQDKHVVRSVPWEFEPVNAVRSIGPPMFMTLLPLRLYATMRDWIGDGAGTSMIAGMGSAEAGSSFIESSVLWSPAMRNLSGIEILLVPRLFMALLSVIFLDGSLWILASRRRHEHGGANSALSLAHDAYQRGPPTEVIVLASSWPCLVFGVRPFTNNLEAMVLALLFVIVTIHARRGEKRIKSSLPVQQRMSGDVFSLLLIGAICAVGIFVRFTFSFFAFPIVASIAWLRWRIMGRKLVHIMGDGALMASSFLLVSWAFVWLDTQYYTSQTDGSESRSTSMLDFIAPFNAFRYNSKSANLAEHGLHPRITHAGE